MKQFQLELRVYDSGTIRWQICLERLQEENIVERWNYPTSERNYYWKSWDRYTIVDDSLEVFVRCSGYGASVNCIVLINNAKPGKANSITADSSQSRPSTKSFPIN